MSLRERREGHGCGLLLVALVVVVIARAVLMLVDYLWGELTK